MYLSARWGCRVRSGAKVALHVLFSEVLALTGLSSLLSVRVCAFQSAFALPEGRGERERAPLGLRSTERLRAKEEENRLAGWLAGWLKCYRFLAAQGQGGKRTVLKWLIFAVPRCRFARVRRTARSSPGLYQATFCSLGSSACYFRYRYEYVLD